VNVGDAPALALRHAFELELQLHIRPVHRSRFQLIVIVAGHRLVMVVGHLVSSGFCHYTIDAFCDSIAPGLPPPMNSLSSLFQIESLSTAMPVAFAIVLLLILVVSFRSRALGFCQYLETMTGIRLQPSEVRGIYKYAGRARRPKSLHN